MRRHYRLLQDRPLELLFVYGFTSGNLDPESTSSELEEIFRRYGKLSNIWVARNPPGFAFVVRCPVSLFHSSCASGYGDLR